MKRTLAAATILLASPAVLAQQPNPLATRAGLELGVQASHYEYTEPDFMKTSGNRGGFVAALTFAGESGAFGKIDARWSYGRLNYEASGAASKIPDTILEGRAVAGLDWVGQSVSLSPYLGLGYRYLYDDLRGYDMNNPGGYRRQSNYVYAPVGVTARWHMGGGWVLAPTLEADVFLYGTQVSKLSDIDVGLIDVSNKQDKGRGHRASLMLEKDRWTFGVWTHYWHIQASDTLPAGAVGAKTYTSTEPENYTRESGLELRYRF
jgi:hypothetical protein